MADTGFKSAATVEAAGDWVSFTAVNLASSDDTRATDTGTSYGVGGEISDFSFGIPGGSTINGIEVTAEFSASVSGRVATTELSLSWDDGTTYTAVKEDTVTGTTDAVKTYGGAADTWGRSWTTAELADGAFRLKARGKLSFTGTSHRLDQVLVKVYYSQAVSQRQQLVSQAVNRASTY